MVSSSKLFQCVADQGVNKRVVVTERVDVVGTGRPEPSGSPL